MEHHGITHHPMCVPDSRDCGSINVDVTCNARGTVKIYPQLVHVIKSFIGHLQGGMPKTLGGLQNQVAAALQMIHSLSSVLARKLGGFRVEVSVMAPSIKAAVKAVKQPYRWTQSTLYLMNAEYTTGRGR